MYLLRCASLPLWKMFYVARLECAPYDRPTEADAREISSIATVCAKKPMPVRPYSTAIVKPSRPISPIFTHRSAGNRVSRSIRCARGAISFSAKACAVSPSRSMSSPSETNASQTPLNGAEWQRKRRRCPEAARGNGGGQVAGGMHKKGRREYGGLGVCVVRRY